MSFKNNFLTSLAVAAFAMIASNLLKWFKRPREKAQPLQEAIDSSAAQAVRHAKRKNIDLDFSLESLRNVEAILSELHENFLVEKQSVAVQQFAVTYGAYIGEVIRRSEPASHWEKDHSSIGQDTYPLHWSHGEMFPMGWCVKRIQDGPEDNILVKYQMLQQIKKNEPPQDAE